MRKNYFVAIIALLLILGYIFVKPYFDKPKISKEYDFSCGHLIIYKDGTVSLKNYKTLNFSYLGQSGSESYDIDDSLWNNIGIIKDDYVKLDIDNIVDAEEIIYGNGAKELGIILLSKDGTISELHYFVEFFGNNVTLKLEKNIAGTILKDIVKIEQKYDDSGAYAMLYDDKGNEYVYSNNSGVEGGKKYINNQEINY